MKLRKKCLAVLLIFTLALFNNICSAFASEGLYGGWIMPQPNPDRPFHLTEYRAILEFSGIRNFSIIERGGARGLDPLPMGKSCRNNEFHFAHFSYGPIEGIAGVYSRFRDGGFSISNGKIEFIFNDGCISVFSLSRTENTITIGDERGNTFRFTRIRAALHADDSLSGRWVSDEFMFEFSRGRYFIITGLTMSKPSGYNYQTRGTYSISDGQIELNLSYGEQKLVLPFSRTDENTITTVNPDRPENIATLTRVRN